MRISVVLVCGLVGCASSPPDEPTPAPTPTPVEPETMQEPRACDEEVALYGATDAATPTSVPFAIGSSDGVNICIELDARDNKHLARFTASTQQELNTNTSMFQLTLLGDGGALLQEGQDVTLGSSPPMAFASVEHDVTKGTMVHVTLHIVAKCVPLGTTIDLALFEP